jgi:hypothetical protein
LNAASADSVPVNAIPAGNGNYIQNSSAAQTSANFNISGNGTANTLNATSQYNIGSARVLSVGGNANSSLFAGLDNGQTGNLNAFFGNDSGSANTGSDNSFFGALAGKSNTTGTFNSFFGTAAGSTTNSGSYNSFFGSGTGGANTAGSYGSFFGNSAGASSTGDSNSFFGVSAGTATTIGSGNSFFGVSAGTFNTTGSDNTLIGKFANVGANNLTNATAIGAGTVVSTSNTIALGRSNGSDTVQIPGALNVAGTLGASVLSATTQFNIGGNRILSGSADDANIFAGFNAGNGATFQFNSFFGNQAGYLSTGGCCNSFVGSSAGFENKGGSNSFFGYGAGSSGPNRTGSANAFFGSFAGSSNDTGSLNTLIGTRADVGASNLSNATAIGANASVSQNNSLVLGSINGVNLATASTNVGIGTTAPAYKLHVVGQDVRVESGAPGPRFSLNFTGGGTNERRWQNYAGASALTFSALNDAENAETYWLKVNRGVGTAISSVVFPNGNVGIGSETQPIYKLQVFNSGGNGLRVETAVSNGAVASFGDQGNFQIDAQNVPGGRFTVTPQGNVGIGTPIPNAKLHVAGGNVYIANPNSLIITSPNGACWFITVNNAGALSTISTPCP